MMKQWSILIILGVMLAGCAANQGHLGNRDLGDVRPFTVREDANGNPIMSKRFADDQMNEMNRVNGRRLNGNNIVGTHENYSFQMNDAIGKTIEDKFGYDAAYVVLTDRNAYVGVSSGNGSYTAKSAAQGRTNASYTRPEAADGTGLIPGAGNGTSGAGTGTNGAGSRFNFRTDGMYDARNNGIYDPRPNADGGRPNTEANRSLQAAGDGADEQLTEKRKAEIEQVVKSMKPSVAHVYVSGKADFVNRLASYAADVRAGQPIQGYIAEFNAMAERIFPYQADGQFSAREAGQRRPSYIYD
ncbi:YhcN/YlaJ family sporulation lipoprotein [Paenibacillus thailandensis]|uniref:YhcN/YlaJ family sporulation lipoprotein n=1 Tax=Paenibacillus thailandensis TaxID=393250 RepID=A0ABW5QTW1_9BACL